MQKIDFNNVPKEKIENHTSKGNQPKWYANNLWYKADHMGYEGLAEYIVSKLLKKSNIKNFVNYELIEIEFDDKKKMGCVSKNFKGDDEILIPIEKLHRQYFGKGLADAIAKINSMEDKIKYTISFIEEVTNINNAGEYITTLLKIDAFFLNEDRHTNNIAVMRNEKTKKYCFAPIFDNGLSLLSDTKDYPLETDVYDNINKVKAKPFDINFDNQLDIAETLYGSNLKFTFTKQDVYSLIDELGDIYEANILKRVEKVLLEQMRKYQTFF